jgi:adhesin/invasin
VTDGFGTVYYTAPSGRGGGSSATIRASAFNVGGEVADEISIQLIDAIVSEVQVTAGADMISVAGVGGVSQTVIRANVMTTSTRPVPDGTLVSFVTTAGMISNVTRTANGVATATLSSSSYAGTATVMAFVDGVSGSAQVEFIAGPPSQIQVSAPSSMEADTTKPVSASITDSQGNPVSGSMMVNFSSSASSGSFSPASKTTTNGVAEVDYTAPSISGSIRITASTSGGISGSASVFVTPAAE